MSETIAALATPPGRGAVAIVRASGPDVRSIASSVFRGGRSELRAREATVGRIVDGAGTVLDEGLALFFAAPRSFTGEDVLELHVHGSPAVARDVLLAVLAAGARLAGPGEFTRRAFLNGKLGLSAAEAVGELVAAEHSATARAAAARLTGALEAEVDAWRRDLDAILEELAAAIDFPDEVAEPERDELTRRLGAVAAGLDDLASGWERGRLVREGAAVAIVGPPNAGKSSLLNALLGEARAIVSPHAGTTRDTIEEQVALDLPGAPALVVRAIDTAGMRAGADELEAAGIARSQAALEAAQAALVVIDASLPLDEGAQAILRATRGRPRVVFFNKADLGRSGYDARESAEAGALLGSVRDAQTLVALRSALARELGGSSLPDASRPHLGTVRQADAALAARAALGEARATLEAGQPVDLVAGDLARARDALGSLLGRDATESLLDAIFARFCIGK
jgi:tRNA modification GTPase